jgi:hypothetical protein
MSCQLCGQECEELEVLEIEDDYYESCRESDTFWACPDCVREYGWRCRRKQAEWASRIEKRLAEWRDEENCDD